MLMTKEFGRLIMIFNSAEISNEEITEAISSLKNGKACGIDLTSNDMLKASCGFLILALKNCLLIIIHCLKSNIQEAQWTILTTQKKKNPLKYKNSHKISLIKNG